MDAGRLAPSDLQAVRALADDPDADPLARAHAIRLGMGHWTALLRETVEEARRRKIAWSEIAAALGVSRQAVSQRFTVRAVEEQDG